MWLLRPHSRYSVAHDDEQKITNKLVSPASGTEESLVQNVVAHADVHYGSPSVQISFKTDI